MSGTFGDGSVMLAGRNSSEAKNQVSQPNSDEIPTNYRALLSAAQTGGLGHRGYSELATLFRARRQPSSKETLMKKTLTVLVAAATLAGAATSLPTPADARCYGCAVGAGLVGGFVAGAIVGSAAAARPAYVVAPGPGYVVYSGYAAPLPGPSCYWTRMPVYDAYGNVIGWRGRPVAVCQ